MASLATLASIGTRFSQTGDSDTSQACRHITLVIRPGDHGAVSCHSCGKRWIPEVE